jgi:hypothetical protein
MDDKIETAIDTLHIGRCTIDAKLRFVGEVIGGGTGGPGKVWLQTEYGRFAPLGFDEDHRSGSRRSGSCLWYLEPDRLYRIDNVAVSSSRTATFYVSTAGDRPVAMSREEHEAECRRRWPMDARLADEAEERRREQEALRMEREAAQAEARRIEQEALKELNAERAAQIAAMGQPDTGLPKLTGTPKQIAYALSIRDAFAAKHPGDPALKRGTTAKYWIENHRSALYR